LRLTLHNNLPDGQHFLAAEYLKGDNYLRHSMDYVKANPNKWASGWRRGLVEAQVKDWEAMNPQAIKRYKIPGPRGNRGRTTTGLSGYVPVYSDKVSPDVVMEAFRAFGHEAWSSNGHVANRMGMPGKIEDYNEIFLAQSYEKGAKKCEESAVRMQLPASMGNIGVRASTRWGHRGRTTTSILDGTRTLERGHRMFTRRMANRPGNKVKAVTVVADLNCPTDTTYWRSLCAMVAAKQLRRAGIQTQLIVLATGWYTGCHAHVGWCRVARFDEAIDYSRAASMMLHLGWRHSWPWLTRAGHVERGWTARNISPFELKQLGIMGDEFLIANSNQDSQDYAKAWLSKLSF